MARTSKVLIARSFSPGPRSQVNSDRNTGHQTIIRITIPFPIRLRYNRVRREDTETSLKTYSSKTSTLSPRVAKILPGDNSIPARASIFLTAARGAISHRRMSLVDQRATWGNRAWVTGRVF